MSVHPAFNITATRRPVPMHAEHPKPANADSKTQKRKANKARHMGGAK
jgi:hypothetical protein